MREAHEIHNPKNNDWRHHDREAPKEPVQRIPYHAECAQQPLFLDRNGNAIDHQEKDRAARKFLSSHPLPPAQSSYGLLRQSILDVFYAARAVREALPASSRPSASD